METVNSSNLRYLNVDSQAFANITLGMTIYLMLSFMRGFIPVTIGFILELPGVTNEVAALFGIIPMISFFLFRFVQSRYNQFLRSSIIVWLLAIIMPNLLLKFILILIGMYISYSLILFLLTLKTSSESIIESILVMIFIDFTLKSINRGNDPIASYNSISIIFVLILTILFSLLNYVNIQNLEINPIEFQSFKSVSSIMSGLSTGGFFLSLLVYFVFFSNPGIITLSLNESDQFVISAYIIGATTIAFLAYYFYQSYETTLPLFFGHCIILLLSVLLVPWEGVSFVFLLIGFFSLVNILLYNVSKMPTSISQSTSAYYFISLLFFLLFLFLIISEDGTILPIIFTVMAGVFSLGSYLLNNSKEEKQ